MVFSGTPSFDRTPESQATLPLAFFSLAFSQRLRGVDTKRLTTKQEPLEKSI